jgi:hypothetical protein
MQLVCCTHAFARQRQRVAGSGVRVRGKVFRIRSSANLASSRRRVMLRADSCGVFSQQRTLNPFQSVTRTRTKVFSLLRIHQP